MAFSTTFNKRHTITLSLFAVFCLYNLSHFCTDVTNADNNVDTSANHLKRLRKRKSNDCEFSTQFNVSRAVVTPDLLHKLSTKDLANLYGTRRGMFESILALSQKLQPYSLPTPIPTGTCVIVGSSGSLLDFPHLGDVIDNYDYVIRLNFAPTKGFEEFVGSKTTMNWSYLSASLKAVNTGRRVNNSHIIYGGTKAREFIQLNSYLENKQEHPMIEEMLQMLNDNKISFFSDYTRRWLQKKIFKNTKVRPTTGLQAMLIIAHWCPTTPDFAGFGLSNKTAKYHYFDTATLSRLHFARDEMNAINTLQKCHLVGQDLTHIIQAPVFG